MRIKSFREGGFKQASRCALLSAVPTSTMFQPTRAVRTTLFTMRTNRWVASIDPHAPANPGYEPHSPAGRELTVGRIYRPPAPASLGHEPHSPAGRELTWFWSITVPVDPKFRIRTHGHAETLERAHAEFQANWDAQSR